MRRKIYSSKKDLHYPPYCSFFFGRVACFLNLYFCDDCSEQSNFQSMGLYLYTDYSAYCPLWMKQRDRDWWMNVVIQDPFSIYVVQDPGQGMGPPTVGMCSHLSYHNWVRFHQAQIPMVLLSGRMSIITNHQHTNPFLSLAD